ncbi:MAG: hypothetical protein ACRC1Z_02730 [Waterburya sp.]
MINKITYNPGSRLGKKFAFSPEINNYQDLFLAYIGQVKPWLQENFQMTGLPLLA